MKKCLPILTLLVLNLFYSNIKAQTADNLANQKTKCIFQYINSLASLSTNKVISGQWMNHRGLPETPQTEFDTAITSIFNQTSKWVGIIGTDYMREHSVPYYTAIENMFEVNQPLINYSKQNGLIAVMATFKNPWNNTNANDLTNSNNLLDIVTTGHTANINFVKQLDSMAKGFAQLQDSNVTVLFRPFQEMNGNWFWWGSKSATLPSSSDFITLWQFVFNYFTITKNLHNILWLYAPSAKESSVGNPSFKTELFYYPGNNFVDIIGLDVYNDTLDIPNYASIQAIGKPIGLAEFGPKKQNVQNNPFSYNYTTLINQIKTKYPALCFWLSWNHFCSNTTCIYYSMSTQNNTSQLLNDNWVINREGNNYTPCITLPTKIVSFEAKKIENSILIQWVTSEEVNTENFEIERSSNGKEFITIGFQKSGFTKYNFIDKNPLDGINYFRLKIIDKDGRFQYSQILPINFTQQSSINIYPNPVNYILNFSFVNKKINSTKAEVVSIEGKVLLSTTWQAEVGINVKTLNIQMLPKGIYYLKIDNGEIQTIGTKFEKM